jgi:hypothetical protein
LFDKHALAFDLLAQRSGNIHVKAGRFAVSGFEGERLVRWVNRDLEVFALGKGTGAQGGYGSSQQDFFHEANFLEIAKVSPRRVNEKLKTDSTIRPPSCRGWFLLI